MEATSYDSIDELLQQQKDEADKSKKKKKRAITDDTCIVEMEATKLTASTKLTAKQGVVQY